MRKGIIAGLTALALFAPALSFAEPEGEPDAPMQEDWRPNADDLKVFTESRIAALKVGLQLTPDQEKKWPAVEQAIRDAAKVREERIAARRERKKDAKEKAKEERPNPVERLRQRADGLAEQAAETKKLADAVEPLYQSLNDDQKRRFGFLLRMAAGPGGPGGPGRPGPFGPHHPGACR